MADLAERLAALATMSPAQLRQEWRQVHRKVPPTGLSSDLLARGISWTLQERVHGKLPPAQKRRLDRYATELARTGELSIERDIVLKPGTRLLREWGSERHRVLVLDEGFQYQDRHYGSLTHIAREITGAGWSGPRFFGLKKRRKSSVEAGNATTA
jgi:hypothetical protein